MCLFVICKLSILKYINKSIAKSMKISKDFFQSIVTTQDGHARGMAQAKHEY